MRDGFLGFLTEKRLLHWKVPRRLCLYIMILLTLPVPWKIHSQIYSSSLLKRDNMAEYDNKRRCTIRGKVVYRRPKKFFNTKDILRIVNNTIDEWRYEDEIEIVQARLERIRSLIDTWILTWGVTPASEEAPEFGGGESGGAGAGGEF